MGFWVDQAVVLGKIQIVLLTPNPAQVHQVKVIQAVRKLAQALLQAAAVVLLVLVAMALAESKAQEAQVQL
jgi:hypothetical protein